MSKPRHTPGPWKPWKGDEDDPERWSVVAAYGDKPWVIATVENGAPGDTLKTEEATARLIAAAPDLLAELEATRDWLASFSVPPTATIQEKEDRLADINAAIAKAKGTS